MTACSVTEADERRFLEAVYELVQGETLKSVSLDDLREHLGYSDLDISTYSDYWTQQEAIIWPRLGHVALTPLGVSLVMEFLENSRTSSVVIAYECKLVSVIIPALNEANTIGDLVRMIRRRPRVKEVLVVDDGSIDGTPEIAAQAGAKVILSSLLGKGASMQDGLAVAQSEIVLFLDGDLRHLRSDLVETMTDPILAGEADMVKASFTRKAGRVTVLTARPLLASFFPELARFDQPLGGIMAARQVLLQGMRFENDYGVDVGLLIDAALKGARVKEVQIGYLDHDSQPLEALGEMAEQVSRVILDRAWRSERLSINHLREIQEMEESARARLLPVSRRLEREVRYALLDMDGVLVDGRYVLELAKHARAEARIHSLLDNHAISDHDRARMIAAALTNVPKQLFEEIARSIPLVEGAPEIVLALRKAGYRVGIVTDSYHVGAEIIRRRVFADFCIAHLMRFRKGIATGELTLHPATIDTHGCRRHYSCKSNVLRHLKAAVGLVPEHTVAVGDGLNDVCLLGEAGLSIAFRPKDGEVERAARFTIHDSLKEVLNALASCGAYSPASGPVCGARSVC